MDLTKDLNEQIKQIEKDWQITKAQLAQATEAVNAFQTKLVNLRGQKTALNGILVKLKEEKLTKDK